MMNALESTSTRPYLIRALYEWCTDNGFTPYVAVLVDDSVQVPREYVKDGEIVLNISFDATSSLKLGNEFIEFKARFAGTAREILVPVGRVIAVYARENGQGMAFPAPVATSAARGDELPPPSAKSGLRSVPDVGTAAESGVAEEDHSNIVPLGVADGSSAEDAPEPPPRGPGPRPALKRVK
ncbi:ClpXP protease specificity-enhancing factor [Variovorax sp. HJSM1_2]|uniref:ClpXP protease specificity-enhancing factor n=1 Tax=Variovorax sp. HJSM1_2 TaxID=3366263 RepID=UPI003BE8D712